MKTKLALCTLILIFSAACSFAQGISYTGLVTVKETPAEDLNYNAHRWLGHNVETEDITANVVEATRTMRMGEDRVDYDIKIEVKDNEYEYTFYNFTHRSGSGMADNGLILEGDLCLESPGPAYKVKLLHKALCRKVKADINKYMTRRTKSLREAMRNEVKYAKPAFKDYPPAGIIYTNTVQISDATQQQLFSKSRVWFSETYPNAKRAIRKKDEATGLLIGISGFPYAVTGGLSNDIFTGQIRYKVKIEVSDGNLKYTISDFNHRGTTGHFGLIKPGDPCFKTSQLITPKRKEAICIDLKEKIDEHAQMLINTLSETIKKEVVSIQNDEWKEVEDNGGYLFSEVVTVENLTKDDLYEKGKEWFTKEYVNANRVLEIKDKDAGELYGKVSMKFHHNKLMSDNIYFDIRLQVKDNQYKYSVYNFSHKGSQYAYGFIYNDDEKCFVSKQIIMGKKQRFNTCAKLKEQINAEAQRIAKSMAEALK